MKFTPVKSLALIAIVIVASSFIYHRTQEVVLPYNTAVHCLLTGTITLDDKPGKQVAMEVEQDVAVKGLVVIAKGTPINATIAVNKKPKVNYYTSDEMNGELTININSTKTVDGQDVNFSGCYIQRFADKNYNWFDKKRKWLLEEGTSKICETTKDMTVKVN